MSIKICVKCHQPKNVDEFRKWRNCCKQCEYEYSKEYSKNNPKRKDYRKKYNQDYRKDKKEKLNQKSREFYYKNQKELLEKKKEYYLQNKEKIGDKNKKYYEEHKIDILKKNEFYRKERSQKDFNFKLRNLLRRRIRSALSNQNLVKYKRTMDLIGCSVDFLKEHLQETSFQNGYKNFDIENYSGKEYHIDHIIPCASFDLTKEEEQRKCFHWSNLQILDAKTNIAKKDKLKEIV